MHSLPDLSHKWTHPCVVKGVVCIKGGKQTRWIPFVPLSSLLRVPSSVGVEESSHCTKGKDSRTHKDRKTSFGAHTAVSLFSYTALCLPNADEIAPHTW